jgi:Flp pilus assembly protein TadG
MKWFRKEEGQVLVLTALCVTCFVGFMALAIDVGLVFRSQRNLQIAADAAATAAALDYFYNSSAAAATRISDAETVGTTAGNNNLAVTGLTATITMHSGDLGEISTPWHNSTGYFEAVLTEQAPTVFMGYFGTSSMTVKARAVAGTPHGNKKACMYVLDPTGNLGPGKSGSGDSTVFLQGSFQLNAPNCGISIDGTAADTLYYNGNGGSTSAAWIGVVGGAGGQSSKYTPQPVKAAPVTDPFNAYTVPTSASDCTGSNTVTTSTGTIGTAGSITCDSAANITNATFNGTVILTAPVITFGGSISSPALSTSGTGGATIVIDNGYFQENAGTVFSLNAQTGGPLPSVILAAPSTNTNEMQLQFGNSSGTFNGIVYMPAATFFFQDSGGDHSGGLTFNIDLVVGQLDDKTTTLNVNGYSPPSGFPSPLALVALVE